MEEDKKAEKPRTRCCNKKKTKKIRLNGAGAEEVGLMSLII